MKIEVKYIKTPVETIKVRKISGAKGKAGYHYLLSMHYTISNGENLEDKMECDWLGEATDYGDKGVNKAITAATKYFIMRLLQVSEKGDEDPDSVTPEPRKVSEKPKSGIDFDKIRQECSTLSNEELTKKFFAVKGYGKYTDKQKETICKIIQEEIDSRKEDK